MEEKERSFYDRIKDVVNAYMFHDPNAQAATAYDRERRRNTVDEKSLSMYRESAEAGHPFSCFSLGRCYENGTGVEKDLEKAYEWYRKAATGGDVNAWLALGKMFDTGTYVDRDPKEAAMWLERAAAKEHPVAMVGLGQKYARGDGVEKDQKRAYELFSRAYEKDKRFGSYVLGEAIGDGIGCEKNYEKALALFRESHENHFPQGTFNYGMMLEMGLGCEKDEKQGFALIKQAADENVPEAMYRIAFHYREGTSEAPRDDKIAFGYFKKAADMGYAPACVEVGLYYENGVGVEMSKEEAFRYYEMGAKAGHHTAIVCLAVCLRSGIGCDPDPYKSAILLEKAIRIGNSRAFHLRALDLLEDDPDDERAINLEMIAAGSGFIRSALFLGGYFLRKPEISDHRERAIHYFRLAAKEGDQNAKFELAELLDTEENRKDQKIQEEILTLYKESADGGNPLAAYNMAVRYKDPSEQASPVTLTESEKRISPNVRKRLSVHYMCIAAAGGIPAASQEVADRSFWGDGINVDFKSACGLYHFCADELNNKSFLARYAFCRVVTAMEFVYGKIGDTDRAYRSLIENSRSRTTRGSKEWNEGMNLLEELADKKIPDALIFLPLAKALSYGVNADLSSEKDQEMLSYIDSLPDSREKYYVKGLLCAILKPKQIPEAIRYLRYARSEYQACNADQVLGNLYRSFSRCFGKIRKEKVMVLENAFSGWTSPLQKDQFAKIRDMKQNRRKDSIWNEGAAWNEKKASRLELLNTAAAIYSEAYQTGQSRTLGAYTRTCNDITDAKMYIVIPGIILISALLCVLVTIFRVLWALSKKESLTFWGILKMYGDTFLWGLLAALLLIAVIYLLVDVKRFIRQIKMKKRTEKAVKRKEQLEHLSKS